MEGEEAAAPEPEPVPASEDAGYDNPEAAAAAQEAALATQNKLDVQALPTDRPLILICRSGTRSMAAANALAGMGFTTYNVVGGMGAWAAAGLPVVAEDGSAGYLF